MLLELVGSCKLTYITVMPSCLLLVLAGKGGLRDRALEDQGASIVD